jgi:hypothetical protein
MQKPIKPLKNKHLNDIKKRINTQKKPISYNTFNALMKELKHKLLKNLICDFLLFFVVNHPTISYF